MKILTFWSFIVVLTLGCYSCNNEEDDYSPSQTVITMEGEGGTKTITFEDDNWRIINVINQAGGQRIFGEIFEKDGKLVKQNSPLELDGLGKLDALWMDKGFTICRKTTNSLEIGLNENATNEEFNFSIIIENNGKNKEILVNQKISDGYTFECIEYYLAENDTDRIYTTESASYAYTIPQLQDVEISPFDGVDIINTSYFTSDDSYAFLWFNENPLHIKVPKSIYEGNIYLSDAKYVYGGITKSRYEGTEVVKEKISIPAGKSKFHVELEWRDRQVSYKLTMKNKRTGNLKRVVGKWLETTPTGKYSIIRDY